MRALVSAQIAPFEEDARDALEQEVLEALTLSSPTHNHDTGRVNHGHPKAMNNTKGRALTSKFAAALTWRPLRPTTAQESPDHSIFVLFCSSSAVILECQTLAATDRGFIR